MNLKSWGKILIFIAALLTTDAKASILRVNSATVSGGNGQTWETPFQKIQEAINSGAPGDEIWVVEGFYRTIRIL